MGDSDRLADDSVHGLLGIERRADRVTHIVQQLQSFVPDLQIGQFVIHEGKDSDVSAA